MSTRGQFNTKNPTIKRILKEASELSTSPSPDYHAEPQETNLFEWHFTIRGPPAPSSYAGGLYHGRIILPPTYPLRPPSFRFLTPTGRFEVNREICLSISGHHEETWQPAWGVRTALVAIRSFMDTDAKGQVGGIECAKDARERMARESGAWKCGVCGVSNEGIMKGREEGGEKEKELEVPEELRLVYRDELGKEGGEKAETSSEPSPPEKTTSTPTPTPTTTTTITPPPTNPNPTSRPRTNSRQHAIQPTIQPLIHTSPDRSLAWIDICIYGVIAALLYMLLRRFI